MSKKSYYESFVGSVRDNVLKHVKAIVGSKFSEKHINRVTDEIMKDLRETFKSYGVDWKLED